MGGFRQISNVGFVSNLFENHYIGKVYKAAFTSCTYTNLDPSTSTGITASVLHKQFDYILGN